MGGVNRAIRQGQNKYFLAKKGVEKIVIDILYKVHEVISQDRIIREHVNINNIKFNKYPNVKDTDVPFIVIDDIDDPIPTTYTDGDECAYSYIVQIDVFVKYNDEYNARIIRNKISNRIQKLLWSELKMGNVSNGYGIYRRI